MWDQTEPQWILIGWHKLFYYVVLWTTLLVRSFYFTPSNFQGLWKSQLVHLPIKSRADVWSNICNKCHRSTTIFLLLFLISYTHWLDHCSYKYPVLQSWLLSPNFSFTMEWVNCFLHSYILASTSSIVSITLYSLRFTYYCSVLLLHGKTHVSFIQPLERPN